MTAGSAGPDASAALLDALETLSRAEKRLLRLILHKDGSNRAAVIDERRIIAQAMARIGPMLDGGACLTTEPDSLASLRAAFAAYRLKLAQHQADWPASAMQRDYEAYMASVRAFNETSQAFWIACRRYLKTPY